MDEHFFHKVRVKEHEFIKEWFLSEYQEWLDQVPPRGTLKTDYHLDRRSPYSTEWNRLITPYIKNFAKSFGVIDQYSYHHWVSQYDYEDTHQWHMHSNTHFGCVYYLELPNNQNSTEFWKKDFPAEEGDLVFFPGWWIHRSAPQMFKERKTIIAGNLNFYHFDFLP